MKPRSISNMFDRIAIIGGGPGGLAAAKALAMEPVKFRKIDIFERRDKLGGIWYYGGDKNTCKPHVPSEDPRNAEEVSKPLGLDRFFSPMYSCLETNIVSSVMEYSIFPFPEGSPTYPSRDKVWEYVIRFSKTLPSDVGINLSSNIIGATKIDKEWEIVVENSLTGVTETRRYDALIVANGHFDVPYIPSVPGLSDWNEKGPGLITHAKYYDKAADYKDKNVLVIGNYSSGTDISTQVSVSAKQVYVSVKDIDGFEPLEGHVAKYVGMVTRYDYDNNRTVHISDGEEISDIDCVIFCTGYLYSLPFMKSYDDIITDGNQVNSIYKQMFYINDPSLAFIALLKNVIPMPCAEAQSALIARYFSGRYHLPSKQEMQASYDEEVKMKGSGKNFHNYKFPLDVEYCNAVVNTLKTAGLYNEGLAPPVWPDSKVELRSLTAPKKAERTKKIITHANKLREEGKDFELLRDE